ncbi:hypothetical protein WJX79_004570 [Trebouxia sp. C0005]
MLACNAFDELDAQAASMSEDLLSWDFLQDLDFDVDQATDGKAQAQVLRSHFTSTERVREQKRKAQQRARQKKKERSANIEAQLAETTSQLQHLRLRQRQLEARNQIKMEDIGRMACTDFAELCTVFVRKQAQCLLDLDSSNSSSSTAALAQLHQWSVEATATFICFGMGNPNRLGTLQSLNMANATLYPRPPPDAAVDELWATMDYSESQQRDMLHLRRLLYGKLGQLSRARAAIMAQLPAAVQHDAALPFNLDMRSTASKLTETKEWADQLCANRAEESRAYLYCGVCLYQGITSSVQQAKAMVHQYPRAPNTKALLENALNPLKPQQPGADNMSADLCNWDFLQDLDFAPDLEIDDNAISQIAAPHSSHERQKERNRKAQQRTRQRKKERSQNIECQLAETTSQLQALKLRQRQLEARNQLLELAAANKLPVSVPQQNLQEMKLEDISSMPHAELAKLYTAYVQKQAQCLLEVEGNSDSNNPALADMHRWSVESTAMLICFATGGASNHLTSWLNMKDGTLFQEPAPDGNPAELLAAMNYSESQKQDILHLRRLFYGKLGQLSRARAAIMDQMPAAVQPSPVPPFNLDIKSTANKLAETQNWADQLCANRAEESRAYLFCTISLSRGITSSLQQAVAMVHQYPKSVSYKALLDVLAQLHNEPTKEQIAEGSDLDDLQVAANWQAVVQYVESLGAKDSHGYCQLIKDASWVDASDLSNWDFLQDLDFGCVLEQGNNANGQVEGPQLTAGPQPTSNERLKEKNRKAQQRARQKKKERSQTIEAQLAETTKIKMEDVGRLPHTDIAKLYTAHVRKVAQCLLDVEGNSEASHSALTEIHRLSVELTAVLICFSMGSPSNHGIIHSLNMETGTLFQEPPSDSNPDELLAATNFTETVQPSPVLPFNLDFKSTAGKLAETKEWADQLCANRAEESRAFLTCGFCLYRGIQTSLQHAVAMVHQYPRAPDTKVLLETVAQLHKEPSVESLVAGSGLDDQQHAASWQAVTQYLESLDANGVHGYKPFRKIATEACSPRT